MVLSENSIVLGGKLHPVATKPWFSRKMVPCCNKTIDFRGKLHPVATKPRLFEENGILLQQNSEFSGATKPDKPCP
jgi:hypothetical protein